MMELIDPPLTLAPRPRFQDRYAVPKNADYRHHKAPRLGDCLLCVAASDDADYFEGAGPGEFAVVDVVTKEKAWFEMPHGATPENVTEMIAGHFGTPAFRVGNKLWFV